MRFSLLVVVALGVTAAGVPCFTAADAGSDAPDLDIGTLVSEGKGIATQQKATDDALKQLGEDDQKLQSDKTDSIKRLSDYDRTAADFMSRCNHQFVQGQELEVAACKAENEKNRQVFEQLTAKQKEIQSSLSDGKTRKAKLDQQKADLALKLEAWKHHMKAVLVATGLGDCNNAVATSAAGDSYAQTLRLVTGYQHCWDGGAKSVPTLAPSAVTQGSPVFSSRRARTPEQAIEEYKRSGDADAGARQKRGLDKVTVPAPGSSGP
jgi:hypothetical protein